MKSILIIILSLIGLNAFAEKIELKNLGLDKAPSTPKNDKADGNGNWAVKKGRTGNGNWAVKKSN